MNDLQKKILSLMQRNKKITHKSLAKKLGVDVDLVEKSCEDEFFIIAKEDLLKTSDEIFYEINDIAIKRLKLLVNSSDSKISLDAIKEYNKLMPKSNDFLWRK